MTVDERPNLSNDEVRVWSSRDTIPTQIFGAERVRVYRSEVIIELDDGSFDVWDRPFISIHSGPDVGYQVVGE